MNDISKNCKYRLVTNVNIKSILSLIGHTDFKCSYIYRMLSETAVHCYESSADVNNTNRYVSLSPVNSISINL